MTNPTDDETTPRTTDIEMPKTPGDNNSSSSSSSSSNKFVVPSLDGLKKNKAKSFAESCGIVCTVTLVWLSIVSVLSIVDIIAVYYGSKYWKDDEDVCYHKSYEFPLSEWLVIDGAVCIAAKFLIMLGASVDTYLDDIKIFRPLAYAITFIPKFSLWVIGIIMLHQGPQMNNGSSYIVNDDSGDLLICSEDFNTIWTVAVVTLCFEGIGYFFTCCVGKKVLSDD